MGLIDKLRKVGGIVKNRLASATGALRGIVARLPAPIRRLARRTPVGLALTAAAFAPQIRRGLTFGRAAITRGIAFVGGQRVVTAAGAGGVVGILTGRKKGEPIRPSEAQPVARPRRVTTKRRPTRRPAKRKPVRRRKKRIPTHRHRVVSIPVRRRKRKTAKRRTHRSPRHRGHKRVSFTTADGRKVSFLANPKARHR